MKPLILASVLSFHMQTALADAPLATPPKPIPMSQVNAYQPKSPAAQSIWPELSDIGRSEVYQVENRYYFKATDKNSNYEILAISAYDTLIRQEHLDSNIDEHSYITGFLDCKDALGNHAADPTATPKKASIPWKHIIHGLGALGYAASTPAGYAYPLPAPPLMPMPTYIRTITPANSPFPAYQVSSF